MPEPATVIGLSAVGAYVTKDVVARLLGPTADYLGGEMQQFTQRRLETIGRIFRNAAEKAQDRLDEPGAVPPRVLRDIVNDGSFQDDELAVEYFGGVLAASRTPMSRDDRSATFTSLISRLSTYQIRSHFVLYSAFRSVYGGQESKSFGLQEYRETLKTHVPGRVYYVGMGFNDDERPQIRSILEHIYWGLHKEDLIGSFEYGPQAITFAPSVLGAELFLRAHGIRPSAAGDILSPDLNLAVTCEISIPPGSKAAE